MKTQNLILLLLAFLSVILADLTCIPIGEEKPKKISSKWINDGYCDCRDGSDETETGACPKTRFQCKKSLPISGDFPPMNFSIDWFYAKNEWQVLRLASRGPPSIDWSKTRDKICDCCDGSDELPGTCTDRCNEFSQDLEDLVQSQFETFNQGNNKRRKYVRAAKQILSNMDAETQEMNTNFQDTARAFQQGAIPQYQQEEVAHYLQSLRTELISRSKIDPNKDYGTTREFAVLAGNCFNFTSNEKEFKGGSFDGIPADFLFTFCPFRRVTQQRIQLENSGSFKLMDGPSLLGIWEAWTRPYEEMSYANGDTCWNGPARHVRVDVQCGVEDRIRNILEPSKCIYEILFETPAACNSNLKNFLNRMAKPQTHPHDEL